LPAAPDKASKPNPTCSKTNAVPTNTCISSAELPDGLDAWVDFSVIEMDGYRVPERRR